MSYGVALRNGVPFTLGTIAALCVNATSQWSPLALWPAGASSPGMWIDPSYSASQWQDSAGTTPLSTVGTVLDSSNPVGLILDRKGGLALGPELVAAPYSGIATGGFAISATSVTRDGVTAAGVAGVSTTSASGLVLVEFDVSGLSGDTFTMLKAGGNVGEITSNGHKRFRVIRPNPAELRFVPWGGGAGSLTITNISVREIPGLHLSQSTSAARPVASGRRNFIAADSNNFSAWSHAGTRPTVTPNNALAPDGTLTASTIFFSAGGSGNRLVQDSLTNTDGVKIGLMMRGTVGGERIRLWSGWDYGVVTLTTSWAFYSFASADTGHAAYFLLCAESGTPTIEACRAQVGFGSFSDSTYQRVNTASDYTATGFPQYLKFDGTDDSMATTSFAAGTLINGMDCMIAVRRYSGANCVAGLYNGIADATKFFGMAESGSSSGCVGSGSGTPTVWVDNVQLTGGTDVTRGTLHTALTPGAWHILELRGLDLSTWTAAGCGFYTGYMLNGALGTIELFASGQDANRDKARARMAAYFGVTLP